MANGRHRSARLRLTPPQIARSSPALSGGLLISDRIAPRTIAHVAEGWPRPGDVVLVTGALGGVGRAAVYAAVSRGAKVVAGVRRRRKGDTKSLGVVDTIALDDDGDFERIPPLDAIANAMPAGPMLQRLIHKVKRGGTIGTVAGEPAGARDLGLVVRSHDVHPDAKRLAELARAAGEGSLVIPIAKRLSFTQIREAHAMAEAGAEGKIVLRMS